MSAMQLTLAQAAGWLTGAQVVGDSATAVARVHSDTRTLRPGDLFVALKGERFDAAQFLAQARTQGAVAALCQRDARGLLEAAGLPGILVDDVRRALGELAHGAMRARRDLAMVVEQRAVHVQQHGVKLLAEAAQTKLRGSHGRAVRGSRHACRSEDPRAPDGETGAAGRLVRAKAPPSDPRRLVAELLEERIAPAPPSPGEPRPHRQGPLPKEMVARAGIEPATS